MDHPSPPLPSFWHSPAGLTLVIAVTTGGFYLLAEHRAHLLGALPYLLLAACPLMHVFMHRGHGGSGHGHGGHDAEASRGTDASTVRRED